MSKVFAVASVGLLMSLAVHAQQPDPFAYKFEMTPLEGPRNPAIEDRYTAAFDACQKRAYSTLENVACFDGEFARQDKALNGVWRTTLARSPSKMRRSLVAAQRRWVAERDQFCKSTSDEYREGTIAPVIYVDCRVEQTIRRTIWLAGLRYR